MPEALLIHAGSLLFSVFVHNVSPLGCIHELRGWPHYARLMLNQKPGSGSGKAAFHLKPESCTCCRVRHRMHSAMHTGFHVDTKCDRPLALLMVYSSTKRTRPREPRMTAQCPCVPNGHRGNKSRPIESMHMVQRKQASQYNLGVRWKDASMLKHADGQDPA